MKMNKRNREALGLALVVSAVSLVVTFIVLVCRKRSLLAAIAALAAVEGAAGAALLTGADDKAKEKVILIREKRAAKAAAKAAEEVAEEETTAEILAEIEIELNDEAAEEAIVEAAEAIAEQAEGDAQ